MTTLELKLSVPDRLAEEAQAAGLLTPEAIESMLRETLRRRGARDLTMVTPRGDFEFDEVLPRLVAAYETGRLVPFIGVGMSRPMCADWPGLIRGLEQYAKIEAEREITDEPEELVRRANLAIAKLRHKGPNELGAALKRALFPGDPQLPAQTTALASIAWPLVLTTNYDNAYVRAYETNFKTGSIAVVGRSAEDCQRVLSSLTIAGRALLWALQGHLGKPFRVPSQARDNRLSSELVVDHAEYRRVTHREPHFRRAFAEVFRHRSFLFLGSGIRETYLQELFGEVLEIYAPSTRTHFAIMPAGEVDPRFMYERFQIAIIEYEKEKGKHPEPRRMINKLHAAIAPPTSVPVSWSWGAIPHKRRAAEHSVPELEVIRGPLPLKGGETECLAVSAGGPRDDPRFFVSKTTTIPATLAAWGVPFYTQRNHIYTQPNQIHAAGYVGKFADLHAFAVRARKERAELKELSEIGPASTALFDIAAERYTCIRMQLLAAGGEEDVSKSKRWSVRPFPTRFSFIQTVRRWGKWRRAHPDNRCRLALHIVDSALAREIASGRIDVLEILRCDDIRFWAEIVEGPDKLERRLFQRRPESTTLRNVCSELCLTAARWQLEISPPATIDESDFKHRVLNDALLARTLDQLYIVPGSTLHFRRKETSPSTGA